MDAKDEIKSRLGIEDVIGEYVQLKRSGRNFKGLSPFAAERTPSFMVSPEKQIWHDFSSGRGGDMFSFVMEVEGLDFRGALELLARKAGVDLEQYQGRRGAGNAKQKERLYEALDLAAKFYQVQFSKMPAAYEYVLGKRQFSKDTALEWRLGYSPDGGTTLLNFMTGKGFSPDELTAAGLAVKRYRGLGDMFRGRIMVPLQDPQGQVIGFTARLLRDDPDAPKYINTPQTVLYDKSRHVYGLHLAKDAIRKSNFVVLVEGNLDVIASHQAGVRQVVATAGTALTEPNLKTLSRFTEDVRLSFDADKAGIAATERAIPIASKVGVSLSIITIPSGKDPDELIKQSKDTWQQVIGQQQYALDWLMERYRGLLDLTTAQGKKQFSDILLPIIRKLSDSVEQDHYMAAVAQVLGVSRQALDRKLVRQPGNEPKPARKAVPKLPPADKDMTEYRRIQNRLLSLLLTHPELRQYAPLVTRDMLPDEAARLLFDYLADHPDFNGDEDSVERLAAADNHTGGAMDTGDVQSFEEYAKILLLHSEELYGGVETVEYRYTVIHLHAQLIKQYAEHQYQKLRREHPDDSDPDARLIYADMNDLKRRLTAFEKQMQDNFQGG